MSDFSIRTCFSGQEVLGPDSSQIGPLNNDEAIRRYMSLAQAHGVGTAALTGTPENENVESVISGLTEGHSHVRFLSRIKFFCQSARMDVHQPNRLVTL